MDAQTRVSVAMYICNIAFLNFTFISEEFLQAMEFWVDSPLANKILFHFLLTSMVYEDKSSHSNLCFPTSNTLFFYGSFIYYGPFGTSVT